MAIVFATQLIEGAIGLSYGLVSTTTMLSLGTSPAIGSLSVHAAELVTTAPPTSAIGGSAMSAVHPLDFATQLAPGVLNLLL